MNTTNLIEILEKYRQSYLKELSFYKSYFFGTYNLSQQMEMAIFSQELTKLENKLLNEYYNIYTNKISNSINMTNSNIELFWTQYILFNVYELVLQMANLKMSTHDKTLLKPTHKFDLSVSYDNNTFYMIGMFENFIDKFIKPLENNLEFIISNAKSTGFNISCSSNYLVDFIEFYEKIFSNEEKIAKLKKFIELF